MRLLQPTLGVVWSCAAATPEIVFNTLAHLACADAILGLYNDAQIECEARLLPEDRLGEVRVEQMVRKGFAGHCMVQVRGCRCPCRPDCVEAGRHTLNI
jgi:hypothetical protein